MSSLSVGFAATDITPPLGLPMAGYGSRDELSQSITDPLRAQALVLQSGDMSCAVICTDLIGLEADFVAELRARAAAVSGLDADRIMLCCSHTHWGPVVTGGNYLVPKLRAAVSADYRADLLEKLAQLVVAANAARVPAVAGWGSGFADGISFNRRQVGPDFKTDMHLVLEPEPAVVATEVGNDLALAWEPGEHMGPRLSEPLEELDGKRVGPADAEVPLLRFDKSDGTPLAALVNFACHAVCGGDSFYGYSADYVGHARAAFEALTGCPMLFADGCAGDQVPRWRQNDARQRVGKSLGAEAARTWLGVDEREGEVELAIAKTDVFLPLNPNIKPLAEAQAALAAHPEPESNKAVWEREMLSLATETQGMTEGYPAELWALRVGDAALVTLPGEVLTEIGMQIKQRSPFAVTLVVSLANGCIGYLPTDNACREGGYEPNWSPVGPGTERVLVDAAVALLEELA
jgi:neutral ceramidase